MPLDLDSLSLGTTALEQVISDYLQAEANDHSIERTHWLNRYPALADDLRAFFADHDQARQWAQPMRPAVAVTPSPSRDVPTLDAAAPTAAIFVVEIGQRFGDYEILAEIARGGMGIVFKARQMRVNRFVALKMILAGQVAGAENVQRFQTEAQAAAHLDHPNIVPLYEVGVYQGHHFFSMKLVEGGSLAESLAKREWNVMNRENQQRAARLIATVARAAHHAHQRGIIHRDLKPANILLAPDYGPGTTALPLIADFGLAKRLTTDGLVTQADSIVGTPGYMAPEQAAGQASLSTAVDVYSLGAILFELLAGRPPFRGASSLDILSQLIDQEPARLRSVNPLVDSDLEIICLKCLKKEPNQRYGSAEALAEDLERWLTGDPIHGRAASRTEQIVKWAKRRPATAALVVVSLAAPLALLTVGMLYNVHLQQTLADVRDLKQQVGDEQSKVVEAHVQAATDARRAAAALQEAEGLRLIAAARVVLPDNPGLALLLALEGAKRGPREAAHNNALAAAWSECRETGPLLHRDPGSDFQRATFFPDGQRVLTTSFRQVGIWDRASGKQLTRWDSPLRITSSSISPDGRYVLMTFQDYSLLTFDDRSRILCTDRAPRLLDTATGKEIILRGHENRVVAGAFSPDSKRVITASWDHTARIWDAADGRQMQILKGHTCSLASVNFSADGKTVITVSSGCTGSNTVPAIEFQANLTGVDVPIPVEARIVARREGFTRNMESFRGGDIVRIWDPITGEQQQVLEPPHHHWVIYGSAQTTLSPDGKRLAGTQLKKTHLWDLPTGKVTVLGVGELPDEPIPPGFSPDSKYVLTSKAEDNKSVSVWDVAAGAEGAILTGHQQRILSARFVDERRIVTTSLDRTCRLWSIGKSDGKKLTGKELMALRGHELEVTSAYVNRDGDTVATASADGTVRFWDVRPRKFLGRALLTSDRIRCAAISPDSHLVATGSVNGSIKLWDVTTGKMRAAWKGHTNLGKEPLHDELLGEVLGISFSSDGKKLLSFSADIQAPPYTPVRIWSVGTGEELGLMGGHAEGVRHAAFSPDAKRVLTIADNRYPVRFGVKAGKDRSARIWDSTTGKEQFTLQGTWREIGSGVWNHDGSRVCTTHEDAVRIWDAGAGKELMQLGHKKRITAARFSPDGGRLLTWDDPNLSRVGYWNAAPHTSVGQAELWDAVTGQHLTTLHGHQAPIGSAAFSPDGLRIVTTAEFPNRFSSDGALGLHGRPEDTNFRDRTARVWDAATGKFLATLGGHLRSVHSARFSKDGQWLVTTSDDRTARIWNLTTDKEFFTLDDHLDGVKSAEFSADGRHVVTVSWDGAARLWPADPFPLAQKRKPRELTPEERQRFALEPPKH